MIFGVEPILFTTQTTACSHDTSFSTARSFTNEQKQISQVLLYLLVNSTVGHLLRSYQMLTALYIPPGNKDHPLSHLLADLSCSQLVRSSLSLSFSINNGGDLMTASPKLLGMDTLNLASPFAMPQKGNDHCHMGLFCSCILLYFSTCRFWVWGSEWLRETGTVHTLPVDSHLHALQIMCFSYSDQMGLCRRHGLLEH